MKQDYDYVRDLMAEGLSTRAASALVFMTGVRKLRQIPEHINTPADLLLIKHVGKVLASEILLVMAKQNLVRWS